MRDAVTHVETGLTLDLADPDFGHPDGRAIIEALHGHMSWAKPELLCEAHSLPLILQGRWMRPEHGAELALQLIGIHQTGGLEHRIPAPMSDQHKRQVEYAARAADHAGHRYQAEKRLHTGSQPDLVVSGTKHSIGIEIQRSKLATRSAIDRTRKAVGAGLLPSVWIHDWQTRRPAWEYQVPSTGMNDLPWDVVHDEWTATATGGRVIKPIKCDSRDMPRCFVNDNRRPCGQWHANWKIAWRGLKIDHIAGLAPEGEIVALRVSGKYVYLVSRESVKVYEEITGRPAEIVFNPLAITGRRGGVADRIACPPIMAWAASVLGHLPGRCPQCGWHPPTMGHEPACNSVTTGVTNTVTNDVRNTAPDPTRPESTSIQDLSSKANALEDALRAWRQHAADPTAEWIQDWLWT